MFAIQIKLKEQSHYLNGQFYQNKNDATTAITNQIEKRTNGTLITGRRRKPIYWYIAAGWIRTLLLMASRIASPRDIIFWKVG